MALAITASGAIGAFALGKDGNREILLILPLILSGLAIAYLKHTYDIEQLGQYLREAWWPAIPEVLTSYPLLDPEPVSRCARPPLNWENWIDRKRGKKGRVGAYGMLGVLPPLLIFSSPGLGALALYLPKTTQTRLVWLLDALSFLISLLLTAWVYAFGPAWKRHKEKAEAPPHTSA